MTIDLKAIEKAAHEAPAPKSGRGARKPKGKLGGKSVPPKAVVRYVAWAILSIRQLDPDAREKALRRVLGKINPEWKDTTGKTGPKVATVKGWASRSIAHDGGEVDAKGTRRGPEHFLTETQRAELVEIAHSLGF